jgi:hypothetical protein
VIEIKPDPTLNELIKIFNQHGLEFYIKKQKGCVIKVHFMIKEEEENT